MKFIEKFFVALSVMALAGVPAEAKRKSRAARLTAEELLGQARTAFYEYNPDLALEKIEQARSARNVNVAAADSLEARAERMAQMIQRVEDIVIVDSLTAPRSEFLSLYRLDPTAGSLAYGGDLGAEFNAADSTVVYTSEDGSTMIWGTPTGLAESHKFTDGTWEAPAPLGDVLNLGATANYPFLMPDGVTLYYASEGEDSLGGLDLYISRRNRDDFAVPQNMGMPYNSPFDDYMLAIDEHTGAGWFATDRNQLGELITIYVFIPAQSRVNLDVNLPDLAERARISSVKATQKAGEDYSSLLTKIESIAPTGSSAADGTPEFILPLPNGKIYTSWEHFTSPSARRLMESYVDALAEYENEVARLEELRKSYGAGNKRKSTEILTLEKRLRNQEISLKNMANRVITEELRLR